MSSSSFACWSEMSDGDRFAIVKAAGLIPFHDHITWARLTRYGRRSRRRSAANPWLWSGRHRYLKASTAKHLEIKAWCSNSFESSDKSNPTQARRSNDKNSTVKLSLYIVPKELVELHFPQATHPADNEGLARQGVPLRCSWSSPLDRIKTSALWYSELVFDALQLGYPLSPKNYWDRLRESHASSALTWPEILRVKHVQSRPHRLGAMSLRIWLSSSCWLGLRRAGPEMYNGRNVETAKSSRQPVAQRPKQESRMGRADYPKEWICLDLQIGSVEASKLQIFIIR